MMHKQTDILRFRAYSRVGLAGNPSDGYFGKTLSFTFRNFYAEVVMYPSQYLELLPGQRDCTLYPNMDAVVQNISKYGYYGGIRLLQAALKRFLEYCRAEGLAQDLSCNFSMRYFTNIPAHVGMAGSSAIITACFRGLMAFYGVTIPKERLATIIHAVEAEELGIGAGLQDRVAQVYQGLTFMDFDRDLMEAQGHGRYESLNPDLLKNVYVAYKLELSEGSEVFHNDLRSRFDGGEPAVVDAMKTWAGLATQVRDALLEGDSEAVGSLLNVNFDLRRKLCRIHPDNIEMVETARAAGASAKFTGSGGAIVGLYKDEAMYQALVKKLAPIHVTVMKPEVV